MAFGSVQTSFTSGELDPQLAGRIDVKHYYSGAERLRNMIVLPQGGVRRRPGLEYIDTVLSNLGTRDLTVPAMPNGGTAANINDALLGTTGVTTVNISTTNNYVVAEYTLSNASVLFADIERFFVTSVTTDAGEFFIQYSIDGGVNYITAGSSIPATTTKRSRRRLINSTGVDRVRLIRIGTTDYGTDKATLSEFNIILNDGAATSGQRLVPFEFSITQKYMLLFTDLNVRVYLDGVYQTDIISIFTASQLSLMTWTQSLDTLILTHELVPPQELMRQGAHDQWEMEDISFGGTIPVYQFDANNSNPAADITPDATSGTVKITASAAVFLSSHVDQVVAGNGGRVKVIEFISTTVVKGITIFPFFDEDLITATNWTLEQGYEQVASVARGFPRATVLHQDRLVFGGTTQLPNHLFFSKTGLPFNFDGGQGLADDGFSVAIPETDSVPTVFNLRSGRNLLIFTSAGERVLLKPESEPLTPSNAQIEASTNKGIREGVPTVDTSGATLFVHRQGKILFEFIFDSLEKAYTSQNISVLSSHLLNIPVDMAIRKSTSTDEADFVLIVNGDGTLAVLTTLRDQEVTAWTLQNTNGKFLNVGVDLDDMYFIVERTVNGAAVFYLEKFNNALYVDSGVLVTGAATTISITHLAGELIDVVSDGAVEEQKTVSGGIVTLDQPSVTDAQAGLNFTTQVKTMPVAVELPDGTVFNKKKRLVSAMLQLFETRDFTFNGVRPPFRAFGEDGGTGLTDGTYPKFTGRKELKSLRGWTDEAYAEVLQIFPTPLTLLMIESRIQS